MLRRVDVDFSSKDDDLSAGCVVFHAAVCCNNIVQLKYMSKILPMVM
jgi:hypothetical protein